MDPKVLKALRDIIYHRFPSQPTHPLWGALEVLKLRKLLDQFPPSCSDRVAVEFDGKRMTKQQCEAQFRQMYRQIPPQWWRMVVELEEDAAVGGAERLNAAVFEVEQKPFRATAWYNLGRAIEAVERCKGADAAVTRYTIAVLGHQCVGTVHCFSQAIGTLSQSEWLRHGGFPILDDRDLNVYLTLASFMARGSSVDIGGVLYSDKEIVCRGMAEFIHRPHLARPGLWNYLAASFGGGVVGGVSMSQKDCWVEELSVEASKNSPACLTAWKGLVNQMKDGDEVCVKGRIYTLKDCLAEIDLLNSRRSSANNNEAPQQAGIGGTVQYA